jgi:aspartyl-tRNA(Asn)/glutamyl-tRNA(Gln) amidotransferase subunit A
MNRIGLDNLTIDKIQQGFRAKRFSSVELTKQYLARIKELNSRLNIYLTITRRHALEQARESDQRRNQDQSRGVLDGVPIAIKDIICTKDILTTAGSKILKDYIPPYNATVIERLEKAGTVMLGKVNMDAFAHGSSTENSDFGVTKNPWDLTRVPGGSSGGSAAAVSAGLAPVSLGSDTGGSIRQPASLCGIIGFKPTYGAVSRYGLIAMASSFDVIGPMTSSVEDSLEIMKVIAGRDRHDSTSLDVELEETKSLRRLRIGIAKEYFTKDVDEDVAEMVKRAVEVFEKQGAEIKSVSLPHTEYALAVYYIIQPTEVASNLARYDGIYFGEKRDRFGAEARRRIMLGTFTSSAGYADKYYLQAQKVRTLIKQDFDKVFEKVDVLMNPVTPTPAFKIGEKTQDPLKMYLSDVLTVPANLAGLPAISVPCGLAKREGKDLPVGLQIIGDQKQDGLVLSVAKQYQKLADWQNMKPKIL